MKLLVFYSYCINLHGKFSNFIEHFSIVFSHFISSILAVGTSQATTGVVRVTLGGWVQAAFGGEVQVALGGWVQAAFGAGVQAALGAGVQAALGAGFQAALGARVQAALGAGVKPGVLGETQ